MPATSIAQKVLPSFNLLLLTIQLDAKTLLPGWVWMPLQLDALPPDLCQALGFRKQFVRYLYCWWWSWRLQSCFWSVGTSGMVIDSHNGKIQSSLSVGVSCLFIMLPTCLRVRVAIVYRHGYRADLDLGDHICLSAGSGNSCVDADSNVRASLRPLWLSRTTSVQPTQ